jgi:hypothetical protein
VLGGDGTGRGGGGGQYWRCGVYSKSVDGVRGCGGRPSDETDHRTDREERTETLLSSLLAC